MEKIKNIKWKDKLLYEKIFTILAVVFFCGTLTMFILNTIYDDNRLLSKLSSVFLDLEFISLGIVDFRISKKISVAIITVASIVLILTLILI